MKFLIKLYPAWWRQRYGRELEALLEDSGSRAAWDLFRGAMEMQMKTWSFGRIVTACGIVGLVLAGIAVFSLMPYPYQSTATLKITPLDTEAFVDLTQAAFSRQALVSIIATSNLYPRERTRMPMENVIDNVMRRAIQVRPVGPNLAQVSFAYEDPVQAQRVSGALVARIISANLTVPNGGLIQLVAPSDQAKKQIEGKARTAFTALGLPAGLLFGVVLALILRRRAPAS